MEPSNDSRPQVSCVRRVKAFRTEVRDLASGTKITPAGVETLKAEARSLARLVRLAAQRHLIVDEGLGQE